jgi:hypothetical protein
MLAATFKKRYIHPYSAILGFILICTSFFSTIFFVKLFHSIILLCIKSFWYNIKQRFTINIDITISKSINEGVFLFEPPHKNTTNILVCLLQAAAGSQCV